DMLESDFILAKELLNFMRMTLSEAVQLIIAELKTKVGEKFSEIATLQSDFEAKKKDIKYKMSESQNRLTSLFSQLQQRLNEEKQQREERRNNPSAYDGIRRQG
ncbi:hypothetical protein Ocin01_15151, partial [Orchesella cincta]